MALSNASFLPDEKDCAESWRAQRWSDGVHCVACGSRQVESRTEQYRGHLCRYHCQDCDRWFNDLSGTALEYSKVSLNRWVYMMRELDKGRPVSQIGAEIEVSYKTALRMAHLIRQGLYRHRSDEPPLSGQVEGDEIHLKGGQQGYKCEHRPARKRALKQRGRGIYRGDRPLICVWVQRDSPRMVIEMVADASKRPLFRLAHKHIEPGSRIDTDSWKGYKWLDQLYDHRTVKHSECYVDNGIHCNTAEAEWSIFKPWWSTFRGVAKRHIHLYLAQYQFRRNRRQRSSLVRLEEMIAILFRFVSLFLRPFVPPSFLSKQSHPCATFYT